MGMKREAVQGESKISSQLKYEIQINFSKADRGRMNVDEAPGSPAAPVNPFEDMPIEQIQDAEREIDRLHEQHMNGGSNNFSLMCTKSASCNKFLLPLPFLITHLV